MRFSEKKNVEKNVEKWGMWLFGKSLVVEPVWRCFLRYEIEMRPRAHRDLVRSFFRLLGTDRIFWSMQGPLIEPWLDVHVIVQCASNHHSPKKICSFSKYFLIVRMLSFFVTFATKVLYFTFCDKMRQILI